MESPDSFFRVYLDWQRTRPMVPTYVEQSDKLCGYGPPTSPGSRNPQRAKTGYMASVLSLEGRMEKRLPIAIVVYLAQAQNQPIKEPEIAYTDNISTHGACVISSRTWKLGEVVEVSSLKDQMALCGKVVHCEKRGDDRYAVGLAFNGFQVTWSKYRSYSGT